MVSFWKLFIILTFVLTQFLVELVLRTVKLVASRLSDHAHRDSLMSSMALTVLRGLTLLAGHDTITSRIRF